MKQSLPNSEAVKFREKLKAWANLSRRPSVRVTELVSCSRPTAYKLLGDAPMRIRSVYLDRAREKMPSVFEHADTPSQHGLLAILQAWRKSKCDLDKRIAAMRLMAYVVETLRQEGETGDVTSSLTMVGAKTPYRLAIACSEFARLRASIVIDLQDTLKITLENNERQPLFSGELDDTNLRRLARYITSNTK